MHSKDSLQLIDVYLKANRLLQNEYRADKSMLEKLVSAQMLLVSIKAAMMLENKEEVI